MCPSTEGIKYKKDLYTKCSLQIHEWLRLPGHEMPHLIMVYFEQPMRTIRQYGLDSEEVRRDWGYIDAYFDSDCF